MYCYLVLKLEDYQSIFVKNEGVIVLAATNFPESLDGALTRPGRFDVTVTVPLPDVRGRAAILEHYFSKTTLEEGALAWCRGVPRGAC